MNSLQYLHILNVTPNCPPPPSLQANTYEKHWDFYNKYGGKSFPEEHLKKAVAEVEEFCNILEQEGIKVRRPEALPYGDSYQTPDFHTTGTHELPMK